MFDWNDLRYFLAVVRHSHLSAAARELGVNHSTVFRRIGALEGALGTRLFDRLSTGYTLTAAGEEMMATAERVEEEMASLDRRMSGQDHRLSGTVRLTSSETLANRLLAPMLATFRRIYPGISVEILIDNRFLSLTRGEADIALRPRRPTENDLVGRQVGLVAWALYGAPGYLAGRPPVRSPDDLEAHDLLGSEERLGHMEAARWLERYAPKAKIVYRTNSLWHQLMAARAGVGLALLPCFSADGEPGLVQVLPPIDTIRVELWLVTHGELRHAARIRAMLDFAGEWIGRERAALLGLRLAESAA